MFSFDRLGKRFAAAAFGAALAAGHGFALDQMRDDPMRPNNGPTVGGPSESYRKFQRDIERAPSLTERFGLPRLSGPIPAILPPVPTQPVFDTPDNAWPPALERARRPSRDRDG